MTPPKLPLAHRLFVAYARMRAHPCQLRFLGWLRTVFRLREVVVALTPRVRMALDPDDFVQRELIFRGTYEPRSLARFDQLIATDVRGCLDFGAHMGLYSLRAAAGLESRGGRVVAVEPTPTHAAALLRNAQLSRLNNFLLCTAAFSHTPGLARMIAPHAANTGGSRLGDASMADLRTIPLLVPVLKAAELATMLPAGAADVLKIDVEGHEFHVLRSLLPALKESPRHILLECKPTDFDYGDLDDHLTWLAGLGYTFLDVAGQPWDRRSPLPEDNLWLRLEHA
jgi:FkbM family methyltransferase